MGFFQDIGRSLGFVKEKKQESYGGPRPDTSPLETEAGKKYYKTIQDRLAGIGVGPEEYLIDINAATNPYATASRANLQNYTMPLISSQASARGLGRSTIPVNRVALSSQELERDIGQRMAEFDVQNRGTQQQNAYLRRNEINDALVRMGGAGETQANAANKAAQFTYDDWTANEAARLGRNTRDVEGAGRALKTSADLIIGAATGGMGGGLTGAALGGLSSLGGSSGSDSATMSALIDSILNKRAGMVDISGVNNTPKVDMSGIDNTPYYKPLKGYYS